MDEGKKRQLRRVFGYYQGVCFTIINMIGTGIFVAPKGVLKYSCMNVGLSLCIWAACALLSMMSFLCSAEIGITFPCSGVQYYFLKKCFGSVIAFLKLWTGLFLGPGIVASQTLLLAEYGIQPFYGSCSAPELPKKCLALAIVWIVAILNTRGVKEMVWLQTSSTMLKMAILGLVSLTGVVILVRGRKENVERFQNTFDAEFPDASQMTEAFFQAFFAYSGGDSFMFIAGELKKPHKTIPKCMFTAVFLVTLVYLLVNISYLSVLTPREILFSDTVVITWADRVIPSLTWVIPLGISASLFSNVWCSVFTSSRVNYIASQEGQLPLLFNMLNVHSSPLIAVLVIVIMASFMIVSTSLIELINYLFFVFSFWTLLLIAGLIKLRYQEPNLPRPYKVSLPFLLVTVAVNLCLVLIPLVKSPKMHYIYIVLFIFSGLGFYIPLIHFNLKLVWFEKMTCYLQLLCSICLPDESDEQMTEVETVKNAAF
ncbi:solute carrier family 7 member 13 [Loxodonta africana]|uniref:solute carrier family 7 member 13 n=1 Tax=Loxodonta africana TaxID=9785 RepID=UPI0002233D93|nr:solute carrier family 7 member 13 [Loxodonta africana]